MVGVLAFRLVGLRAHLVTARATHDAPELPTPREVLPFGALAGLHGGTSPVNQDSGQVGGHRDCYPLFLRAPLHALSLPVPAPSAPVGLRNRADGYLPLAIPAYAVLLVGV